MTEKETTKAESVTVRLEPHSVEQIEHYGDMALYGYRRAIHDIGCLLIVGMIWWLYLRYSE